MANNGEILREPPIAGDETQSLIGSLERQRRTFAWKCSGLEPAEMRTTVGASSIALGGLVKHLALVEVIYFLHRMHGRDPGPPWNTIDWDAEPDWEWRTGTEDPIEAMALWQVSVTRSRAALHEALDDGGLDRAAGFTWPDGSTPSVRRLLLDIIEEYARHVGHADLIRESIDGLVGEDPPD